MIPIYRVKLSGGAWQLLWWLIANMDERGIVSGRKDNHWWKARAAMDIERDRSLIYGQEKQLKAAGLIESETGTGVCRVRVENISV